ncbi:MAG: glycosyltransferase [Chitinophagaceae bacterium]|nr:MAG: glycosyltransferase [Chitinophagaceae bacterium]
MSWPKITIVTPSYNQGKFLEQTIRSVLLQNYPNLEYIIIDGGSDDETSEILEKYSHWISYSQQEKDGGQGNAINIGFSMGSGFINSWINSDDYLADGSLFKVAELFCKETDMIAGGVQNFDAGGYKTLYWNKKLTINDMLNISNEYVYHQPGVWMRTCVVKQLGGFRKDLHYCFDQEFMLRYLAVNDNVIYLNKILAFFRLHQSSKTVSESPGFQRDFQQLYNEYSEKSRKTKYAKLARRKKNHYDWLIFRSSANLHVYSRLKALKIVIKEISTDPFNRLNAVSLGWLKHILFGKRNDQENI